MPDEQNERLSITAGVASTDWSRYAGQASHVKRRGERRKRRRQAGTAAGTAFAVVGVAIAVNGLGKGSVTSQGAPSVPFSSPGSVTSGGSASNYPSFPAKLPTKPMLVANPGHVLASGVIGAGTVSGHQWQISYRVIPSGSAANSQPQVHMMDISLDGKTVSTGGGEGAVLSGIGYQAYDQQLHSGGNANPMVVAIGSPSPGVTSVDLRWKNGTVVQVPIQTVTGTRFASFAWDPANPPEALEQVGPAGVQKIRITRDGSASWSYAKQPKDSLVQASPPSVSTPTGTPNLSQTPHVTPISSGILGEGTVSGHQWQVAYEIIPSGSAENSSNEVFCDDTTVDGKTTQGGCTSSKPFASPGMYFTYHSGHEQSQLAIGWGGADPGTTSIGLEWADGTKTASAVQDVEGVPMAALAFDPANAPAYLLEFGSYGAYRIPLASSTDYTWTFNWPNG